MEYHSTLFYFTPPRPFSSETPFLLCKIKSFQQSFRVIGTHFDINTHTVSTPSNRDPYN